MDKKDKIKLLMEYSGGALNTLVSFKQKIAGMPFLDEPIKEKVIANFEASYGAYVERQIEIYAKWLSEDTIDQATAFYTSKAGQDIKNNMPHIVQDLAAASTALMANIFTGVDLFGGDDFKPPGEDIDFGFGNN